MISKYTKQKHFPDGSVHVSQRHIDVDFPIHWHDYCEIEYVLSGTGKYWVDGQPYRIQPHMLFLMNTVDFHESVHPDTELINVSFTPDFLQEEKLSPLFDNSIDRALLIEENHVNFIETILFEMLHAYEQQNIPFIQCLLEALLLKLNQSTNKDHASEHSYAQKALFYLQNNFRSPLTLQSIAEVVNISPYYLSKLFSTELGTGFKACLNGLRFNYAEKLLQCTSIPIVDICFESGFSNYANFERGFKSRFGVSPSAYRENYQKKKPI